jgi:AcrR family transcriptional regulator
MSSEFLHAFLVWYADGEVVESGRTCAPLRVEAQCQLGPVTAVAQEAGVGDRTVYVRFGTKAALLKRAVDVAIVGDTAPVDVQGREWFQRGLTAATLEERVDAMASGAAGLMERAGPLLAVAREAEATEPVIAAAAQKGREAMLGSYRMWWEKLRADGLIGAEIDMEWAVATTSLLGHADTYQLMLRTLGWDIASYERWLYRALVRVATYVDRG